MIIELTDLDRKKLTALIQTKFGVSDSAIGHLIQAAGANCAFHFYVETDLGNTFGLKIPKRPIPGGNGQDKEKLIADIALSVEAPNACRTEFTNEIISFKYSLAIR